MHPTAALMIADGTEQEMRRTLEQRVHLRREEPPDGRQPRPPRRFDFRLAHLFGLAGS
jgi:hypothetical protein